MSVLFLASGPYSWASSRYRCYWPARYMRGAAAVEYKSGASVDDTFDAYVWQKTGNLQIMQQMRADGKRQYLDWCDPLWRFSPRECAEMLEYADGVIVPTDALADDLLAWRGVAAHVIPDRLDLTHYQRRGEHTAADPVRLIWYGAAVNRISLFAALAPLEWLVAAGVNVALTICDDRPEQPWNISQVIPIYHARWDLEHESRILGAHDIALCPPYPGPWGRMKSNNKKLAAWACGMPATDAQDFDALSELATVAAARNEQAESGRALLESDYRVERSAAQYAEVCGA